MGTASMPSPAASTPEPPPGIFNPHPCTTPAYHAAPAPTSPMRPPGSWGVGTSPAFSPACAAPPKRGETRQVKKSAKPNDSERTTVMLRNLPSFFTRSMLVELLDSLGFPNMYNFIHLPVDISRLSCLGFGFVNFRTQ